MRQLGHWAFKKLSNLENFCFNSHEIFKYQTAEINLSIILRHTKNCHTKSHKIFHNICIENLFPGRKYFTCSLDHVASGGGGEVAIAGEA